MSKRAELLNTYGDWTVLKERPSIKGIRVVVCICVCGKIRNVVLRNLRFGKSKNCGCKFRTRTIERNTKHGLSKTLLYKRYYLAKTRCKRDVFYKNIKFEWSSFEDFYLDMNDSFEKHLKVYGQKNTTLDRICGNKGYNKNNCKWSTMEEQQNNRKSNTLVCYKNNQYTVAELYKHLSPACAKRTFYDHIRSGIYGKINKRN